MRQAAIVDALNARSNSAGNDLLTREGEYRSRPHQPAATG